MSYNSYAARRRRRRRREEDKRRIKQIQEQEEKRRLEVIAEQEEQKLSILLDFMTVAERAKFCYKHGKELIDLAESLLKLPKYPKGRSFFGSFRQQEDRLYGKFYFGNRRTKFENDNTTNCSLTKTVSIIIHPDCRYSIYPKDCQNQEELQITKTADITKVQASLVAWADRVDPYFEGRINTKIALITEHPVTLKVS